MDHFTNSFSYETWYQKYKAPEDNRIEDTWRRVAKKLASVERDKKEWEEKFYELMRGFSFVPGGRILSNAGSQFKGTSYLNCFVDGPRTPDADSLDGIYAALHRQATILKSEGGYGFCANFMRPRGAKVGGVGIQTPGAVKFLDLWDRSSEIITAGSGKKSKKGEKNFIRKGAQMVTMSIMHPDIEEFIEAKRTPGRLTKFNMSVLITDDFMRCVDKDGEWQLRFPNYEAYPKIYKKRWVGNFKEWEQLASESDESDEPPFVVYKTVKARDLWNKIMKSTYDFNDPGVLFEDNINNYNNLYYCEYINSTNPSLRKGTYILTTKGPRQIQDLQDKSFEVVNLEGGASKAICRLSGRNKQLFKVKLQSGFEYFATAEHRWATDRGELTTAELKNGDRLPIQQRNKVFCGDLGDEDDGFLLGWLLGGGWITVRSDNGCKQVGLIVSQKDYESGVADKLVNILKTKTSFSGSFIKRERNGSVWYEINTQNKSIINYLSQFEFEGKEHGISDRIMTNATHEFITGLINGYLSSDGHIDSKVPRIVFTSKHKKLLSDISEILGFFGIRTSLIQYTVESSANQFPNGKDYNRIYKGYRLYIMDMYSYKHFTKIFCSDIKYKQQALDKINSRQRQKGKSITYNTVVSVEPTDLYEDVWDITVYDQYNCFSLSHCITHNCGEIPLPIPHGVCLLGSFNLVKYVDFEKRDWNYDELKKDIRVAVRMLDNVNDVTPVFLKETKEFLQSRRRIGMGVMGLGSALLMMNIRYGNNDECLDRIERLMKTMANEAYSCSSDLAKEKGSFAAFDADKFLAGQHVKLLDESVKKKIKKQGLRNSHLLSIQPTGNTACLANLVSGGLEPIFMFEYIRTAIQPSPPDGMYLPENVDWAQKKFTINGDTKWEWITEGRDNLLRTEFDGKVWKYDQQRGLLKEEKLCDYGVSYLKERGLWDESADWAVCTNDLKVEDHIKPMSIFAKWVCNAISKTVNIPSDYPYESFKDVYYDAWANGLKGITTYRAGTMSFVLAAESQKSDDKEHITKTKAPDRPKELPCDVHHITVRGEQYFVLVGMFNGDPYEIFAGKNGFISKKTKSGTIIRLGRPKGVYKAILEDGLELSPINATCSADEDALTRMCSTALRHGADMHMIVQQLEKVKGDMMSFAKSMARALKKYIPDGVSEGQCPECGGEMIRQEGCKRCLNCTFSACS